MLEVLAEKADKMCKEMGKVIRQMKAIIKTLNGNAQNKKFSVENKKKIFNGFNNRRKIIKLEDRLNRISPKTQK